MLRFGLHQNWIQAAHVRNMISNRCHKIFPVGGKTHKEFKLVTISQTWIIRFLQSSVSMIGLALAARQWFE